MWTGLPELTVRQMRGETEMMFVDYHFHRAYDGSIIMDDELKAESLQVKDGDVFVVKIVDDKIILQKQTLNHGHSRADQ